MTPHRPSTILSMSRRMTAFALVAVAGLVAACSADDPSASPTAASVDRPATETDTSESTTTTGAVATNPVLAPICAALNASLGGEVEVAKMTFDHGPLHTLADQTIAVDRGVAARLLEAKEAVEADLASPVPEADALVADLESLIVATANALVATGATEATPACDPENL